MIPFGSIAIVQSKSRLLEVLDLLHEHSNVGIGIMLRDPEHRAEHVRELARLTFQQTLPSHLTLISNSVMVDGIPFTHLPSSQLDEPLKSDEALQASAFGCSAHSLDEALRAEKIGARYITLSPIFPTASKPGHPGLGLDMLRTVAHSIRIPLFALGGINADNMQSCLDAGAYGIGSISMFESMSRHALAHMLSLLRSR